MTRGCHRDDEITVPDELNAAIRFRTTHDDLVEQELSVALKMLSQRIRFLESRSPTIEAPLRPTVAEHYPDLLGLHGVGPPPASSGKTVRFRLGRGDCRKANHASSGS